MTKKGIIVGTLEGHITRLQGVRALFDRRLTAKEAVRTFLTSCQRKQPARLVRLNHATHTAFFAPSGAGKNVSIVEPFLLSNDESAVVIDLKGENCRLTAAHRANVFGHTIVAIDPFKQVTDSPASFNVLDGIDPESEDSFEQVAAVTEALVPKDPNDKEPHWIERAQVLTKGVIHAVIHFCPPDRRSLQDVAEIMSSKELLARAIQGLKSSTGHDGLLARMGHEMGVSSEKELDGILSTANRSLAFLSAPAVVASTKGPSGFDPNELGGTRPVTVYLVLPMHLLRSQGPLMRLWLTGLLRGVVARGAGRSRPVNFVCDEIAQLGPLEVLSDMLTIGRGYSIKLMTIWQSMAQLKKVFPAGQEGVLLSNTTQVFFGIQDNETARYVSERMGEGTIVVSSGGTNSSRTAQRGKDGDITSSRSAGSNDNWSQMARRLAKPEELMAADPRRAFTLAPGCYPIATWLVRYYEREFKTRRGIGPVRALIDTTCLALAVALVAVGVTARMFFP